MVGRSFEKFPHGVISDESFPTSGRVSCEGGKGGNLEGASSFDKVD